MPFPYSVRPPSTIRVWPVTIAVPAQEEDPVGDVLRGARALQGVFSTDCCLRSAGQSSFHGLSTTPDGRRASAPFRGRRDRADANLQRQGTGEAAGQMTTPALCVVAWGTLLPLLCTPAIEAVEQIAPLHHRGASAN